MRRVTWLIGLVLAAGALAAAGCGDDEDSGGGSGGETLTVTADPGGAISWDKSELSAKAGKVTLELVNQSSVPHAIEVEGNGVEEETETVTGKNAEVTVDLKAGDYEFYCPVDDHRKTMKGTLTVE